MCGIAGLAASRPIPDEPVRRMVDAMRHRGPDDDGHVWIVFNGEIYNFRQLRSNLEACGHRFRLRADTEVVLHAYMKWGPDCVHRCRK